MTVATGQSASVGAASSAPTGAEAGHVAATLTATVGIIINPLAGTDVRRLVSGAAPMPDMHKVGIIRRAVIGAVEGGATTIVLTDDRRALAHRALEKLDRERSGEYDAASTSVSFELLPGPPFDARRNSVLAAQELRDRHAGVVIVLGGDGTHRDVVKGWRDATLIAVSTGTNNVFPRAVEATLAGHAAGAVASAQVDAHDVGWQAKVIDVEVRPPSATPAPGSNASSGTRADPDTAAVTRDLALVDLAFVANQHIGSRAVWDPSSLRELVCTIAEPASVGLSAIGAAALPCGRRDPGGIRVRLDTDRSSWPDRSPQWLRVPVAPGQYGDVHVAGAERVSSGQSFCIDAAGGGVLSIDGERDILVAPDAEVEVVINDDGPLVVDVDAALTALLAGPDRSVGPVGRAAPSSAEAAGAAITR